MCDQGCRTDDCAHQRESDPPFTTRTHAINPDTGEFTRLDQESDMPNNQRRHREQMGVLDQIRDTLAEIRDRLPEPEGVNAVEDEPTDITEEPPVGSQVTDREGYVWERRKGGWTLWWPKESGWIVDLYGGARDPWPVVRNTAPLRFTTDEDRKRVGLPVEPAPADVDPDEALAMDLYHASLLIPPVKEIGSTAWFSERNHEMWLGVARAAREHIEAERIDTEVES